MTSSAENSDDVINDDTRQKFGSEAIEQLASGLNLAAHTIEEFSQNTIDEESLKQLNDEQLFRLLEEAYHSKKLDEKNKSAIFKEILEDVHESLATPDKKTIYQSSSKVTCTSTIASSPAPKSSCSVSAKKMASNKNQAASTFDSIAALTEIMAPSSHINIPVAGSHNDPDADTSSTKTEVEEMELDQFSDLDEADEKGNDKKLDENGNPPSQQCSSSTVTFAARQLKPLSIYRHNPAFHSQHVSVNQMDEIPPLSPSSLQPNNSNASSRDKSAEESKGNATSIKARRKKKAVKAEETIKAEEIDGYRGADDLESLLQFIESKPKSNATTSMETDQSGSKLSSSKWKRSRRTDHKSKRSRTPSVTTPSKEKSPELPSQKTSRASSTRRPELADTTNDHHHHTSSATNSRNSSVNRNKDPDCQPGVIIPLTPDSVTTVKNSLIAITSSSSNNAKKTLKKPKKQAGWLVDFNNESNKSARVKSKPPSGKPQQQAPQQQKKESSILTTDQDSSEDQVSIHDEIINQPDPEVSEPVVDPQNDNNNVDVEEEEDVTPKAVLSKSQNQEVETNVCINYESILKFIKKEWDIVTMEISNGSKDIQSKVVYYKPREKV